MTPPSFYLRNVTTKWARVCKHTCLEINLFPSLSLYRHSFSRRRWARCPSYRWHLEQHSELLGETVNPPLGISLGTLYFSLRVDYTSNSFHFPLHLILASLIIAGHFAPTHSNKRYKQPSLSASPIVSGNVVYICIYEYFNNTPSFLGM